MIIYKPQDVKVPALIWLRAGEKIVVNSLEVLAEILDDPKHVWVEQIDNILHLPFIFKHFSQMPDGHMGYGMPIGGVLATKDVIIPNAVGVDIGCGMCVMQTTLRIEDIIPYKDPVIKTIMGEVRKIIPVGFTHHKEKQSIGLMPDVRDRLVEIDMIYKEYENALTQLGTLGGGNHFIEFQKDTEGFIWVMIHSGSRNLGYKVAKHYNNLAIELNNKYFSQVNPKWQLAFLPIDSEEAQMYISEMNYCVEFALANRELMMTRTKECIYNVMHNILDVKFYPNINIAHNYASLENHYGSNVWVHRKGATLAREGIIGIIPGSQGTNSYIVEGLGNSESFHSCSHGAGRILGRKQAKNTLDIEKEIQQLEDKGIIHSIRNKEDLDEAPGAYKDIKTVMNNQSDLVKIITELTPLGVIKG